MRRFALGRRTPAIVGALAIVYVVWGSTYLGIALAIETLPPLLMAGFRFLLAGGLLYAWARARIPAVKPGRREWGAAAIVGGFLLLGGNGSVVWAEQHVPSGIVALVIATVPLWMALLERAVYRRRLHRRAVVGLLLGFAGIVLLVGSPTSGRLHVLGLLVVLFGALAWALGSLYSRGAPLRSGSLSTAMQMLAGGALLTLAGVLSGDVARLRPAQFSLGSVLALAYLIVFGSLVGFSAYIWLLRMAPTSTVSTYAYVNPVVAVFLGWVFLDERVTPLTLLAGAVIVVSVAVIVTAPAHAAQPDEQGAGGVRQPRPGEAANAGPGPARARTPRRAP